MISGAHSLAVGRCKTESRAEMSSPRANINESREPADKMSCQELLPGWWWRSCCSQLALNIRNADEEAMKDILEGWSQVITQQSSGGLTLTING